MDSTSAGVSDGPFTWKTVAVAVVVCVGIGLLYRQIDIAAVHRMAEQTNGVLGFVLLVVLPLVGFPVSVLYVAAGVRYGIGLGLALSIVAILFHVGASYALVGWKKEFFARRFERVRKKIPQGSQGPVALFVGLIPGVPYFAKNYVLPVAGVPLRRTLCWCVPVHLSGALVGVLFGDQSDKLTAGRVIGFVVYFAAVGLISGWVFRRLRARLEAKRAGEGKGSGVAPVEAGVAASKGVERPGTA